MDQLGTALLGRPEWTTLKYTVYIIFLLVTLGVGLWGLDILLRPLIWIVTRTWKLCAWFRGRPATLIPTWTVHQLEWRGPGTRTPVDNDFFRDSIRARNLDNRKPNDLVVCVGGAYARVMRTSSGLRPVNRHGQLWEVEEVISSSSQALRRQLEAAPDKLLCLCRSSECGQTAECLHVKAYAGLQQNHVLLIHGEQYSPTALCCGLGGRVLHRVRTGVCGLRRTGCCYGCCGCGCSRRRRGGGQHLDGTPRHPDSDSEVEEMGRCQAECIAWMERDGNKVTLLSKGACPDPALPKLTPILHRDLATSDVAGFPKKDGTRCAPLCRNHSNQYLVSRQGDRCCIEGCHDVWVKKEGGVAVCSAHEGALKQGRPLRRDPKLPPELVDATAVDTEDEGEGRVQSAYSAVPPPSPHPQVAVRKGPTYEVRVLYNPHGTRAVHYRFLGHRKGPLGERVTVTVPALSLVASLHRTALGPWEDQHWKELVAMQVPVLARKWDGGLEALRAVEGTATDGATMPASGFSLLQGGKGLRPHFLGRVVREEGEPHVPDPGIAPAAPGDSAGIDGENDVDLLKLLDEEIKKGVPEDQALAAVADGFEISEDDLLMTLVAAAEERAAREGTSVS